ALEPRLVEQPALAADPQQEALCAIPAVGNGELEPHVPDCRGVEDLQPDPLARADIEHRGTRDGSGSKVVPLPGDGGGRGGARRGPAHTPADVDAAGEHGRALVDAAGRVGVGVGWGPAADLDVGDVAVTE